MDEARRVLARLRRIEILEREGAHPRTLLAEVRALLEEAEEWVRCEGDARARAALESCRKSLTVQA